MGSQRQVGLLEQFTLTTGISLVLFLAEWQLRQRRR
jgi:hypothetical protein